MHELFFYKFIRAFSCLFVAGKSLDKSEIELLLMN